MEVQAKRIVELKYVLREGDGNGPVLEVMDEHWPFKFMFGAGVMLPAFERELEGLPDGAPFAFTLKAKDAYGEEDAAKHILLFMDDIDENDRFPLDAFEKGDFITLTTADKRQVAGEILQLGDDYLVVNTNHVMAGKDLHFEGRILFVREARPDELRNNRYIEPNGYRSHSTLKEPPNV
jgi:FKBP-type peptidyl-prolyl cis-trans isomerase SlyD